MSRSSLGPLWYGLAGVAASLAIGLAHAQQPQPSSQRTVEVSEQDFVSWAKSTSIPIKRWKSNPELEAYLDDVLAGRRFVFLGEPGHFFQEKYDIQLLLIECLARRGYRHLFIEGLGATASEVVNDFVCSTSRSVESKPATPELRYRARILGQAAAAEGSFFQRRLAGGQRRFFEALRDLNRRRTAGSESLRVHPLDIDMPAGGCRFTIDTLLARYDTLANAAALRQRCDRKPDEPVAEWFARVQRVRETIDADPDASLDGISGTDRHRFRQCVDCLVESLAFVQTRRADGTMERALVRREPAMFRQVQAALERLPRDAKVIMMGHCNHLSRVGADTLRARRPSLGEMIGSKHPGEIFSIWMLHDRGSLLSPMSPASAVPLRSDPERIESLLVRAGSNFVLPLQTSARGERYLDRKRRLSYFSWYEVATLTAQTDALFFVDEVTPIRE